ncbi:hypothetical protein SNE40_011341 [Patella caerulea]|uniref:ATP synthase mitochondrial F1 complex assembly factor 1 n=2 Tax=Patella caerulea TaxID=87958 RepID=A0AAN8JMX2_PATCE
MFLKSRYIFPMMYSQAQQGKVVPLDLLLARFKSANIGAATCSHTKTTQTTIRPYVTPSCQLCEQEKPELQLEHNAYYEKYKTKLQDLAKKSPEEFNAKLQKIAQVKEDIKIEHKKDLSTPPTVKSQKGMTSWPPKKLDDIMKLDLIKDKTSSEIEQIWVEHFVQKDCVFGVLKEHYLKFNELMEKSKKYPNFIYPLPKQDGYEFYLSEFKGTEVYFTSLIQYQRHTENAPPCLSLAHFTEFQVDKGIVLMAGVYDDQVLSKKEALNLVRQMSQYYGNRSPEHFRFVQLFNEKPEEFDYLRLISEYKMMQTMVESELPV